MPKSGLVQLAFEGLTWAGAFAASAVGLLAVVTAGWIAWQARKHAGSALAAAWAGLIGFSMVGLVVPLSAGLLVAHHLLLLAVLVGVLARGSSWGWNAPTVLAASVPAAALAAGAAAQMIPAIYTAMGWSGPGDAEIPFRVGEATAALSPLAVWWAYGRGGRWTHWVAATLPAFAFAAVSLAAPSMAGVLAIWSTGLTLYLPWPLYALSLWLAAETVLVDWRRGGTAAAALLLLAAGGYSPQLSSHALLGLVALWLLALPSGARVVKALAHTRDRGLRAQNALGSPLKVES